MLERLSEQKTKPIKRKPHIFGIKAILIILTVIIKVGHKATITVLNTDTA
jgi:hypothetical protein